ncbi:hypothetical protein chiPu_0004569 [Chiloscyllium punctatum]|uniref:Uncharacterized protein n=1 Tax=Chiloscyllium punctatum TaxID=137246 RepID=A0A401S6X9_CHIPU|nr:hypothetical protein [Chiloscyllium punctatum]
MNTLGEEVRAYPQGLTRSLQSLHSQLRQAYCEHDDLPEGDYPIAKPRGLRPDKRLGMKEAGTKMERTVSGAADHPNCCEGVEGFFAVDLAAHLVPQFQKNVFNMDDLYCGAAKPSTLKSKGGIISEACQSAQQGVGEHIW